jgi:hypothetical protein
MLLVLLLRDEALPALERFVSVFPPSLFVSRENGVGPTYRAWELLGETLRFQQFRPEYWRLCGEKRGDFGDFAFGSRDIPRIADAYDWCLMPWGTEFTGMMVALVSWDDRVIGQAKEILFATQCSSLIVCHYTVAEVASRQFRGAVFNRTHRAASGGALTARELWFWGI